MPMSSDSQPSSQSSPQSPVPAERSGPADPATRPDPAGPAAPLVALERPGDHQCLLDVVYAPRDTALRRAFEAGGAVIAEGTEMLIHQGAQQVRLMTGRDPDTGVMRAALEAEVASREGR
mgnify:CR=1 FL=1